MKILHISDTHGELINLQNRNDVDAIVHSGDFMPNSFVYGSTEQRRYQKNWIGHHKKHLKNWIGDRMFLLTTGNHDFYDPCEDMRRVGIDARPLNLVSQIFEGLHFYGLPYVPYCGGHWYGEMSGYDLETAVARIPTGVDVLVSHCPPLGILDETYGNVRIGNHALTHAIDEKILRMKAVLCGHCHEDAGTIDHKGTFISNAARTQRIIDIV